MSATASLLLQPPWIKRMSATATEPSFFLGPLFEQSLRSVGYTVAPLAPPPHHRLIADGLKYGKAISQSNVGVVFQGYGLVAAARARTLKRTPQLILHTWKFPGIGGHRLRSQIMDQLLAHVIRQSSLVVLNSKMQQRQGVERFAKVPTLWLPVVADIDWFTPGEAVSDVLSHHGLADGQFILCVGDIDRDERVPIELAKRLGRPLVRVTRDPATAARAREQFDRDGFHNGTVLLNVPWISLRDLYRRCWALLTAPTVSFHPAGLTTLTEGMACGAPVLFPAGSTVEGHMDDGVEGLQFQAVDADAIVAAAQRLEDEALRARIVAAARARCENQLNLRRNIEILVAELKQRGLVAPVHSNVG